MPEWLQKHKSRTDLPTSAIKGDANLLTVGLAVAMLARILLAALIWMSR
jgi:hypothetical protein